MASDIIRSFGHVTKETATFYVCEWDGERTVYDGSV